MKLWIGEGFGENELVTTNVGRSRVGELALAVGDNSKAIVNNWTTAFEMTSLDCVRSGERSGTGSIGHLLTADRGDATGANVVIPNQSASGGTSGPGPRDHISIRLSHSKIKVISSIPSELDDENTQHSSERDTVF